VLIDGVSEGSEVLAELLAPAKPRHPNWVSVAISGHKSIKKLRKVGTFEAVDILVRVQRAIKGKYFLSEVI
jgi:hypothetical protein